jgi:hypothetical protein
MAVATHITVKHKQGEVTVDIRVVLANGLVSLKRISVEVERTITRVLDDLESSEKRAKEHTTYGQAANGPVTRIMAPRPL